MYNVVHLHIIYNVNPSFLVWHNNTIKKLSMHLLSHHFYDSEVFRWFSMASCKAEVEVLARAELLSEAQLRSL